MFFCLPPTCFLRKRHTIHIMHLETLHKALPPPLERWGNHNRKNTTKHIKKGTDVYSVNTGKSLRTPPGAETIGRFQCSPPVHVHSDCKSNLNIDFYISNKPEQIGKLTHTETLNQPAVYAHVYLRRTHPQLTVAI